MWGIFYYINIFYIDRYVDNCFVTDTSGGSYDAMWRTSPAAGSHLPLTVEIEAVVADTFELPEDTSIVHALAGRVVTVSLGETVVSREEAQGRGGGRGRGSSRTSFEGRG